MCCSTQQTTCRLNHAIGWAEWKQVLGRGACVALYSRNIKIGRSTNRCRRWCESGSLYSPQCRKWLRPFDAGWGGLAQFIWLANGTTTLRPRYPLIMHPQHIGRAFFRFPDKVSFLELEWFVKTYWSFLLLVGALRDYDSFPRWNHASLNAAVV